MRAASSSSSDPSVTSAAEPAADVYVQRFYVSYEYPVLFTTAALDPGNPTLARAASRHEPSPAPRRVLAVVDAGLASATPGLVDSIVSYASTHDAALSLAAEPEIVPGGEAAKVSNAVVDTVLRRIHDAGIDRKSCVLVIGGGAVQDAAGYAASIAHRGVRVIRMPTTVESQCDSGVGVKTAINSFGTKNYIGSFAPPFAVVNDRCFLATLSPRDARAGMAEAVKVALLRDPDFFEWLWRNAEELAACDMRAVQYLVRRTAELHLEHIAQSGDPFEHGAAKPLDFGHWAAHKLESLSHYELRHGEAVAIGLAIDTRYAVEHGLLSEQIVARVCVLLERLGFGLWHEALAAVETGGQRAVMTGLEEFREHLGGALTLTLLGDIGRPIDVHDVDAARVERAIAWLEFRSRSR
jgi:3-dehydroquinate synthase